MNNQTPPSSDSKIKPWKLLSTSMALDEKWFKVRKDEVELPSGKVLDDYFIWESPHIATIVPFTEDGKFVLVRQYRHAVEQVMYQFPAGGVNKDEPAKDAALREMEEETGYTATDVISLSTIAAYPTKLSGLHHLFLAKNAKPGGNKQEDENEPTEVVLKTPEELQQMIDNNEIQVADSLAAVLLALRELHL